jgi:hypothetical protein
VTSRTFNHWDDAGDGNFIFAYVLVSAVCIIYIQMTILFVYVGPKSNTAPMQVKRLSTTPRYQ